MVEDGQSEVGPKSGNAKGGRITVPLTSCLTSLTCLANNDVWLRTGSLKLGRNQGIL
jgi:hypothetical protein